MKKDDVLYLLQKDYLHIESCEVDNFCNMLKNLSGDVKNVLVLLHSYKNKVRYGSLPLDATESLARGIIELISEEQP